MARLAGLGLRVGRLLAATPNSRLANNINDGDTKPLKAAGLLFKGWVWQSLRAVPEVNQAKQGNQAESENWHNEDSCEGWFRI